MVFSTLFSLPHTHTYSLCLFRSFHSFQMQSCRMSLSTRLFRRKKKPIGCVCLSYADTTLCNISWFSLEVFGHILFAICLTIHWYSQTAHRFLNRIYTDETWQNTMCILLKVKDISNKMMFNCIFGYWDYFVIARRKMFITDAMRSNRRIKWFMKLN